MSTEPEKKRSYEAFGRRLQAARIEAGYRITAEIAKQVGRSARQVQNYELGNDMPQSDVLSKWAVATGRPVSYFLAALQEPTAADYDASAHPGVTALAVDTALCNRHHVTAEELRQVSLLSLPWPLRTTDHALLAIELLLRLPPDE